VIVETPRNLTRRQKELLREFEAAGNEESNHSMVSDFARKARELFG